MFKMPTLRLCNFCFKSLIPSITHNDSVIYHTISTRPKLLGDEFFKGCTIPLERERVQKNLISKRRKIP